jgi:tRNA threonylcarbamoyladenosine biosynthesis protein TsaE
VTIDPEPDRFASPNGQVVHLADADATEIFGERLAAMVRPGDVIILTGELGAGKTTLTRGLGRGLNVRGPITSPTFVLSRIHPPLQPRGPALVHLDAYRIDSPEQIDDLDIDVDDAVIVVEWGHGLVEHLSDSYLEITLTEPHAGGRTATVRGFGSRWNGEHLGFPS